MNPIEAAQRIGEVLDEDGLAYGIGGALALGVWGAPRATKDVDLSVFVGRDELARVIDSLERAGVLLARDEVAKEVERIGLFVGRLGKIRVDVFISQHPQFAAMANRVQRVVAENGWSGAFLSIEDVTLYKLVYHRSKDTTDLERLFAAKPGLDLGYVRTWLEKMFPTGDPRFATLDDLERRFVRR